VDFEAELPRSPTGKLLKRIIRNRYWKGRTRTGISAPAST
jgi:acyl-CoA synthetase (AMP-forming)/AMP-acid ligase II